MSARVRPELGFIPLIAVVFFNVSGGPYGIEDAVSSFGPGLCLVLLVLTPLVWSLPVALAMSELAAALPEEGGYVEWVRRAFGPFWGFQAGWWSWLNSFVDVAVYPALFADYLKFWWPNMSSIGRWAVVLAFIWILTAINLAGVRITGVTAVGLGVLALAPMLVFTAIAGMAAQHAPWRPFAAGGHGMIEGIGLGLAVMMWNYSGWDNPTTCLGETRSPGRSFRRAQFVALPLITLAYVLPVAAALAATGRWADWDTGYWPVVAAAVGGPRLAALVTAGALVAAAGLFLSLLLTSSRLPFALAAAGQMPAALARVHPRFGTPWAAVIASSVVLQHLRLLELQGADRPEHLALLDHPRPGARGLRGAAVPRAGAPAAVAGWGRIARRVGDRGAARGALRPRDGHRGVDEHGRRHAGRADRTARVSGLARSLSHLRCAARPGRSAMAPMDPADHLRRAWRVHALAAAEGLHLHDVWEVDAQIPASTPLERWIEAFRGERRGVATRVLFGIRWAVGWVLRLDGKGSGFRPVYAEPEEQLFRIENRTVVGFMHLSLADRRPRIAVYVRPKGRLGALYMRLIDPFRRAVVYPGLLAAGRRAALRVGARARIRAHLLASAPSASRLERTESTPPPAAFGRRLAAGPFSSL